jgi:23S rRNA pseudouridine1911/1915/1917 synthase
MGDLRFNSTVPPDRHNLPLVQYLAARFTYLAEARWAELIRAGRVVLNGATAVPDAPVARGDTVTYCPEPFEEPEADLGIGLLYEDSWVLCIDKPARLLVHRAGNAFTRNIVYLVRTGAGVPAAPAAVAVNRLDRETSGVMLVAKKPSEAQRWSEALGQERSVKRYTAIVHGVFPAGLGVIDAPIGKEDPLSPTSYRHAVRADGREARTAVESVESLGSGYSLVTLRLLTGRTHQIRLHCSHVGCPVVGDRLYGGVDDRAEGGGEPLMTRQALHCSSLELVHPHTSEPLRVVSPLPQDMRELIQRIMRSTSTQVLP